MQEGQDVSHLLLKVDDLRADVLSRIKRLDDLVGCLDLIDHIVVVACQTDLQVNAECLVLDKVDLRLLVPAARALQLVGVVHGRELFRCDASVQKLGLLRLRAEAFRGRLLGLLLVHK